MAPGSIDSWCQSDDVRLVRLLYVGNDGLVHGHTVESDRFERGGGEGVTVPRLVQSFDALGRRVKDARFDATGEVRLVPDRSTFRVLEHEADVAAVVCSLYDVDGESPWAADPRSRLESFVSTLEEEEGLVPRLALESEFQLYSEDGGHEPHGDRGLYSTDSMRSGHHVVVDVVEALEAQDVDVREYCPEYAAGQHEIVTGHGSGLEPVDDYVFLRETVAGVAASHDLEATFLPHPFDGARNGCHVHLSLWDDENRFAPDDAAALGPLGRHFVGGVLSHLPALLGLTAPTVNSYARLRPQCGAAAFGCWGVGNREAAVRVPEVDSERSDAATRIEFRPADNTANPYLAVLGLLAAGRDGVRREIDPGEPLQEDPGNCDRTTLRERGIERLPSTLDEALDALAEDDVLRTALGDPLLDSYLTVKRNEWESFASTADTWERETLRDQF